jgi:hypothetical protein
MLQQPMLATRKRWLWKKKSKFHCECISIQKHLTTNLLLTTLARSSSHIYNGILSLRNFMLFLYTSDPDRHLPVIKRLTCPALTRIFSAYSGCVRVSCLQYVLMRALRSLQRSISAHFCVNVLTGFPQAVFETIFDDEADAHDSTLASFLEPKVCTQALHPPRGGVDSSAPF